MARHRRSLEALLADVTTSARGDRAEVFSTPEMVAVNADMIEDYAVNFDILHPEVKTNLDDNTQAVVDINATLDTALPDLDNRLTNNKTSLDQAKLDITQAQADIASVNSIAVNATTAAQTADTKAVAAQSKADQATIDAANAKKAGDDAAAAASAADTKATNAATAATNAQTTATNAQTAANNAATAASTADGKAVAAQSKANQATTDAAAAKTAADNAGTAASTADGKAVTAQNTANGKSKVIYSTSPASGANTAGDVWFQKDANGVILAQWEGTGGTTWASRTLGSTVIAALDAGKITTGTLSAGVLDASIVRAKFLAAGKIVAADITAGTLTSASGIFGTMDASVLNAGTINVARLNAGDIRSKFIEAGTINASEITTGTLTSASGVFGTLDASIINAGTINAARYNATDIRAKFIAAGKITASDITASTLTSASGIFGTMDASVLNAGTLNAARIAAGSIAASKLIIGSSYNAMPDPSFRIPELNTARFARSTGTWTLDTVLATAIPTVSHLTTTTNDGFHYAPANPTTGTGGAAALQVKTGQKITMSVDVETDISAGVRWNLYKHNADGTVAFTSASGYSTAVGRRALSFVYTVPDGVVALDFALACNTTGVNWKVYGNAVAAIQTGATLIENDAITTGHIAANAVTATEIAADTITANEIAANAITATELAANAVTATKILAGSIATTHMTANTINADRLIASSITADKLAANSIDGKKITGATIVGGEVRTTEATAAITARMGPQSVWDIQGGQTRAGIGFSKVGTNDAYPAGMYSTDGYNVYLQQSNGGGAGGSYIGLGTTNQNIYSYSFGENEVNSRGNVTIGSTMGSVSINGANGVMVNGLPIGGGATSQFSFSNSWTNFGGGYGNVQVQVIAPGVVLLQGMAKPGSKVDGITIGVLPPEFRPNRTQNMPVTIRTNQAMPNANQPGLVQVNTNGNVNLYCEMTYITYVNLSNSFFLNSP